MAGMLGLLLVSCSGRNEKIGDPAVQAHLKYFHESGTDILKVQFEQTVPRIRDLEAFEPVRPSTPHTAS